MHIHTPLSTKTTLKSKRSKYASSDLGIMDPGQELEFPSALMKDAHFTA